MKSWLLFVTTGLALSSGLLAVNAAEPVKPGAAAPAAAAAKPAAPAPVAKIPACANPNGLGVSRVIEIDTTGGPGFGFGALQGV